MKIENGEFFHHFQFSIIHFQFPKEYNNSIDLRGTKGEVRAADGCVTRWNLPQTQGYPRESGVNTGCPRKGKAFAVWEGPAAYQLVGKVTAYQGYDG